MKLYRYTLPYSLGTRKGLLVQLAERAWGEIAPLPGWSKESLEEALLSLQQGDYSSLPSVAFGIESATLSAGGPLEAHSLPLAALLIGSSEEIIKKAKQSQQEGYTHAKVKISHLPFAEALDVIRELKALFRLRIDLNRAWSLESSLRFFSHFSYDSFDYIEEPVSDLNQLRHFTHPFALDETLREEGFVEFLSLPHLKALIFKPSLQGGASALKQMMSYGKPIVLSSAFESGIGIFQIASLIKRLSLPLLPLGLDTYRFLKDDLLETSLLFSEGKIHLPSSVQPNMRLLRAI